MKDLETVAKQFYPVKLVNGLDQNFDKRMAFIEGAMWGSREIMEQTKEILGKHPYGGIPKRYRH